MSGEACLGAVFAISYFFFINLQYKDLFVNLIFQKMMPPSSYIYIILLSLGISYVLKLWFTRLKKFDAINHRSVHQTKATKTGGMAVFITLFLFSTYFYLSGNQLYDFSMLIPLGIMFVVGVYDDFYNADFKLKFCKSLSARY